MRNVLNRRNLVAVRRDTGSPSLSEASIEALATRAFNANPSPIPYESPRYRGWADADHNGTVEGQAELLPLYLEAARDAAQPLFYYGQPRLFRLGMEVTF